MKQFRIEHAGSGIKFTPEYAGTLVGALRIARKKGWYVCDPSNELNHLDMRPHSATIFERSGNSWEKVATVTAHGIQSEDHQDRDSYKNAIATIDKAKAIIESTYRTMSSLNAIADKEHQ